MDWRSVAFDWNRARAFLVTAEEGSFSAAARALGVAQPTLGRQVAALEQELGITLFERVGNTLTPTAAGLDLLDHVRAMGEAANRVSLTAAGQSEALDGTVQIGASEVISAFLLPPVIAEIRREHPGIELELVVSNQPSDLRRREADIAIRNFRPNEPDLVARKLRESRAWLYAAPSYLERIGNPTTAAELSERLEIIVFDRTAPYADLLAPLGITLGPRSMPIRSTNHLVQWELVKQGVGACIMMEEVGDAEPHVRRLLREQAPVATFPWWLTCHRELRTSRRIRVVFDWLARALGDGCKAASTESED